MSEAPKTESAVRARIAATMAPIFGTETGLVEVKMFHELKADAALAHGSTILLHCLIYKPHRELEILGLRPDVANRAPVRLLLTASLQNRVCVSDMA